MTKYIIFSLTSILLFTGGCQSLKKDKQNVDFTDLQRQSGLTPIPVSYSGIVDFRYAAKTATPGVVNIRSSYGQKNNTSNKGDEQNDFQGIPDPFRDFFKDDPFFRHFDFRFPEAPDSQLFPMMSSGSGVILSTDGYIVTNNHVIENASEIEVTLYDRRTYIAKVIGVDPQTDLALIKIEEKNLSFIFFGNSDSVEVGEWVVAVGNPFNLASTVTAGIVSAKARNIHILKDQGAIESFIQTDAAINPGNSGGALVTLDGKLIGINTAIATPTGTYAGYAFAIPSDIVKKVVNDLMNYGVVQRGFLGVVIQDLNNDLAKELNIKRSTGVYVDSLVADGAAKLAGIKKKDVIISIDDMETASSSQLQEIIAKKKPGEKIKVKLIRNGEEKILYATLKNSKGNTDIIKKESNELLKVLGVELADLSTSDKEKYKVKNGVKVTELYNGKLKNYTDIREGFVIIAVNNKPVHSVKEFISETEEQKRGIMLEGKYAGDPTIYYYAIGM